MILDSSSILAILLKEAEAPALVAAVREAPLLGVGAPTLSETGVVLGSRLGFQNLPILHRFLQLFDVNIISFETGHWIEAMEAYRRFGKGRHPAGLNFGDCLTYAVARIAALPLLCVGDDFPQTDLPLVPWKLDEAD